MLIYLLIFVLSLSVCLSLLILHTGVCVSLDHKASERVCVLVLVCVSATNI